MASEPRAFTADEYLALERASEAKSEYFNGQIFGMGRASPRHVLIVSNLVGELGSQLKGGRSEMVL